MSSLPGPSLSNMPVASIDVRAIQHNLDLARACAPNSKVLAMVKGNAYGHGVDGLVGRLQGIDGFGVARVEEGRHLRALGVTKPIVVLQGFIDGPELDACVADQLTPTLHSDYQLRLLATHNATTLPVWLKADTGMHRLGFTPAALQALLLNNLYNVTCIVSHLANAGEPAHKLNQQQLDSFLEITANSDLARSMANSGAILALPMSHFEWIRPGIMLYGSSPGDEPDLLLQPAMTLTAPIVAVKSLAAGEAIGYGGTWTAPCQTRIGIVGIGYADGYPREIPPQMPVWVAGKRCPIVGRVSMDSLMVDLGDLDVEPPTRVEMWGKHLPVDEVAKLLGSIGYTLMSRLTSRVQREYID
jgi:alanine racemase